MQEILNHFPNLTEEQIEKFDRLGDLYRFWNAQINVISRKDMDSFYTNHVLHSLAIAKVISFLPKTKILDVGTGGGFPGIPLAILFPESEFFLVDSIGKKIKVVDEICNSLELGNVTAKQIRAERINEKFHFVVSRAVTQMPKFVDWVKDSFLEEQLHQLPNGILYLKGGDLSQELAPFKELKIFSISDYFDDKFFESKKVVYLPVGKFKL